MASNSGDLLQHPRRNLGNRYRSQAQKFVRVANMDESRFDQNMSWAEQNARQAILHDFTDEKNWRCLADIKIILSDEQGLHSLLEDIFAVLGRDPEQIEQLDGVNFLVYGLELLEAAFHRDPLNPDSWWSRINSTETGTDNLEAFVERCKKLNFTDQRANIIFGRRIERIKDSGNTELFIELAKHLLAHRPNNHELWLEVGRIYERNGKIDDAWICYDHVQNLRPHISVRDQFMERLTDKMDGKSNKPWTQPTVSQRDEFLKQMVQLTKRVAKPQNERSEETEEDDKIEFNPEELKLQKLISAENYAEAFFAARRLLATGEEWAEEYLNQAKMGLGD